MIRFIVGCILSAAFSYMCFFLIIGQPMYTEEYSSLPLFQALPYIHADMGNLINFRTDDFVLTKDGGLALLLMISAFLSCYTFYNYILHIPILNKRHIIQEAFTRYMSPRIITEILEKPETLTLGGRSADVSIYFIDIQHFSDMVSSIHPKQLVEQLNEYFTAMADTIKYNEGTIDKFEGDAIMAFWGAPKPQDNHAYLSCKTAIEHQKLLSILRTKAQKNKQHEIYAKIAIVSGNNIVGNVGSKGHFNYTVIGESVNQCAEIEKLNKVYQTQVLTDFETFKATRHDFVFRKLDTVELKSARNGIDIYELIGEKQEVSNHILDMITHYEKALQLYKENNKREAKKAILLSLQYSENHASKLLEQKIDMLP